MAGQLVANVGTVVECTEAEADGVDTRSLAKKKMTTRVAHITVRRSKGYDGIRTFLSFWIANLHFAATTMMTN